MTTTIPEAILALRKALGLTQQGFAVKLGLTVSAVSNYEAVRRIPEPAVLFRLQELAEENKQAELATLFRSQMYIDMGVPDSWEGVLPFEPKDGWEKLLVAGLLAAWRIPDLRKKAMPGIIMALEEPCNFVHARIENHQVRRRNQKTINLMRKLLEQAKQQQQTVQLAVGSSSTEENTSEDSDQAIDLVLSEK